MKPFALGAIVALFLAALIPAAAQNQNQFLISINDPSPLAEAVRQLQLKYGIGISYEDVVLVYTGNYARALDTDWGRKYAERGDARFNGMNNIASVGGSLDIPIVVDPVSGTLAVPLSQIVQAAIEQHKARGNPGEFKLVALGDDFAIVPSAARDQTGKMVSVRSPLDYPISFPSAERRSIDTIQLICDAVTAASGIKVSGPGIADNLLFNTVVTIGANGEIARKVLVKVLRTLQWRDLTLRRFATIPKYSWHLYYGPAKPQSIDPGLYALNLLPCKERQSRLLVQCRLSLCRVRPVSEGPVYSAPQGGTVIGMILAVLLQTTQVDLAPTDPAITVTRIDSTYSVAVTNNTTHDIAGLAVAWLAEH